MTRNREPPLVPLTARADVTRRDLLKLLAGGTAALGASCLEPPGQDLVPYAVEPPELRPGGATVFASALMLDGYAHGVIASLHDGRPTKLDGNPLHPMTRGGSTAWMQARILDLYDPQRAREVTIGERASDWDYVAHELAKVTGPVWLVMPPCSSAAVAALLARVRERVELHVVYDAPLATGNALRGCELAFGHPAEVLLDAAKTALVVALDADVLQQPAWARGFAQRRAPGPHMNRLWVCEPMLTPTGTLADHRLAAPAGDVAAVAVIVLDQLAHAALGGPALPEDVIKAATHRLGARAGWALALAEDLVAHRGAGAVIVGERQPPVVHALARWIDALCGNAGETVTYTAPALLGDVHGETLDALAAARPRAVIALDTNPAYTAPERELFRAPLTLHVGMWRDETARACRIHVPLAHDLEAWGDARAYGGTRSIIQPLIRPRFSVVSPIDVLAALAGTPVDPRELVQHELGLDDKAWRHALATGFVAGTASPTRVLEPRETITLAGELRRAFTAQPPLTYEIATAPSYLHDGRFAGNAWLQELPHPVTKQTWGNAALMSPTTASALNVGDGDVVRIAGKLALPALIVDEHADDAITIEAGYGRACPELPIANGIGANAFALPAITRAAVVATGERDRIARTQNEMRRMHRALAPVFGRDEPLDELAELRGPQPSLFPLPVYAGLHWAMAIDTSICTGCSACMVACQAENNVPTVGPDDVARGRHMGWLRIDRYVEPQVNQPMMCQHCETAPCEYVCPVGATVHSPDGLNEMVYNRCVGTRFCSNNCPYKVRRFNWFAYEREGESTLQYNPDVTVRSRGVMEKCTYCVQRIRGAEIRARVEHREVRAGEVVTACQQACPTAAIQFGALEHGGPVAAGYRDPRGYAALHDLGTRPRTRYLARITNPKVGT
jgi:molybdopterin-containing oxidoreductase family iron-sulfur binding subunit